MKVNCGFQLKKGPKKFVFRSVAGIELPNGLEDTELRKELLKHAPDERGWTITGYFIVKGVS